MLHHAYCIATVLSCDISNIQRTYSVTSFNHSYFNAVEHRLNYIVLHIGSHGKVRISHLLIQLVLLTISLIKLTHSCCLLPSSKGHLEMFWFRVSVVDIYLFDWQWVRVVAHCRPEKDIAAFAFGRQQQEVLFDAHSCCLFLKSSKGDLDTFWLSIKRRRYRAVWLARNSSCPLPSGKDKFSFRFSTNLSERSYLTPNLVACCHPAKETLIGFNSECLLWVLSPLIGKEFALPLGIMKANLYKSSFKNSSKRSYSIPFVLCHSCGKQCTFWC